MGRWKTTTLLFAVVILGSVLHLCSGRNVVSESHQVKKHDAIKKLENLNRLRSSDWLIDLIEGVLGMNLSELLKLIYSSNVELSALVEMAEVELNKILINLNPESRDAVKKVILDCLQTSQDKIQSIVDQLDQIMPFITNDQTSHSIIVRLIENILNMTLEEFLTSITHTMITVDNLILTSIKTLHESLDDVTPTEAESIDKVIKEMLGKGLVKYLKPVLDMLKQLFPQ